VPNASDASDAARPDAAADVAHQLLARLADVDAGKSVVPVRGDPVQGGRIQGACLRAILPAQWAEAVPDAVAAPCTQDAAQSAEQSCAEQASWEQPRRVAPDAARLVPQEQQVVLKQ
jgi:hypothetical protein